MKPKIHKHPKETKMHVRKMTKAILIVCSGGILSTALLFTACKKDSNSSSSPEATDAASLSASSATTDNQYNDVLNTALQTGVDGSTTATGYSNGTAYASGREVTGGSSGFVSCATITVSPADTTSYPKTISIDFGTGCTDGNGVTRKGKITYVFSGRILVSGTTVSATFDGYSVNGYQLGGAYSITNNSSGDGISFMTSVSSGQVTFPDASSYNFSGSRTVTQTAGVGTLTLLDDIYSITGHHNFSSSAGKSLVDSVTTPLTWKLTCPHIVSGALGFVYTDNATSLNGTFDYGSGDCDAMATVKVGAVTKMVTLP